MSRSNSFKKRLFGSKKQTSKESTNSSSQADLELVYLNKQHTEKNKGDSDKSAYLIFEEDEEAAFY